MSALASPDQLEDRRMTAAQPTTAELALERAQFALLDFEATGVDQRSRVVEIAIVHFSAHDPPTIAFESLVRPEAGRHGGTDRHGIDAWDLRDAPHFRDVLDEVVSALAGRVVAAFCADYDLRLLGQECALAGQFGVGGSFNLPPYLCVQRMLKSFEPRVDGARHNLKSACDRHQVPFVLEHVAREDALAAAHLARTLMRHATRRGAHSVACLTERGSTAAKSLQWPLWHVVSPCAQPSKACTRPGCAGVAMKLRALRLYFQEVYGWIDDGEVTVHEADDAARLRGELGIDAAEMRAIHGRVLGHWLGRFIADDRYDADDVERLTSVMRCLSRLGWAPGEPAGAQPPIDDA
jgi:DNA polymerase III epsilon subunit-like protein